MLADLLSTKIAYANANAMINTFITNLEKVIINPLIYFLFALAVVYFLYGVLEFLMNQANEEKKTSGKSHMIWGIVGITIMIGVWTIMGMILSTLGINYVHPDTGNVDKLQS
jgi:uncharacterized membrane protein YidH (DUF202 family)